MKLGLVVGTPDLRRPLVAILSGPDLAANLRLSAEWGYDGVELALREPALLDRDAVLALLKEYRRRRRGPATRTSTSAPSCPRCERSATTPICRRRSAVAGPGDGRPRDDPAHAGVHGVGDGARFVE